MSTKEIVVNGERHAIDAEGDTPLLWVLRDILGLTGTKYGCGKRHCGACTVLVDGRAIRSCRYPMRKVAGKEVVTIEGLARGRALHPLQQAFVEHDALQCGFCTPGMIMNAVALLQRNTHPSREQILRGMSRNLCRCGSHTRVVRAIESAARQMKGSE